MLAVGLRWTPSVALWPVACSMPSSCAFHVVGPGTSLEKRALQKYQVPEAARSRILVGLVLGLF